MRSTIKLSGAEPEVLEKSGSDFLFAMSLSLGYQTENVTVDSIIIDKIDNYMFNIDPASTECSLAENYALCKPDISWNTNNAFTCVGSFPYEATVSVYTVDGIVFAAEDEIKAFCPEGYQIKSVKRVSNGRCDIVLKAPEIGHFPQGWSEFVAAGCETCGEERCECRNCNISISRVIEPIGHEWGEWKVVKEASETEEGIRERVCKRDPLHKETETIAPKSVEKPQEKKNTVSVNKLLSVKDAEGRDIVFAIEYTAAVSYNGLSHVSQLCKPKKSVTGDVLTDISCSLNEYATPVLSFKNNKNVPKTGKAPVFTVKYKAKKGCSREQKKVIKAVNRELKSLKLEFAVNPFDLGGVSDPVIKLNGKKTKVKGLSFISGGRKFRLSAKDYTYVINADGSIVITAKAGRNYSGEITVKY